MFFLLQLWSIWWRHDYNLSWSLDPITNSEFSQIFKINFMHFCYSCDVCAGEMIIIYLAHQIQPPNSNFYGFFNQFHCFMLQLWCIWYGGMITYNLFCSLDPITNSEFSQILVTSRGGGGFFGSWFFIILRNSHQDLSKYLNKKNFRWKIKKSSKK